MTLVQPFERIAILNRGEPAMRFVRAARDYQLERGVRLEVIAFYTDPDADAPFVRQADLAVRLGTPFRADRAGKLVSAYLDHDHLLALLSEHKCDAVWPGWGFISEDADFVERLTEAGIVFLGPTASAMRQLGDKIASKQLAQQAGVPLTPWQLLTGEETAEQLETYAARIGFPLMVKASGGGGGRGIRRVDQAAELAAAVRTVAEEVRKVFGKGGLFLESCVTGARHVEVQLACPRDAKPVAVGVRDCSVQRRNQKVVEESPSPILPEGIANLLCDSSERLAELAGYHGVGTAEFLYRPEDGAVTFLEVNSRLQVEHTVTELTSGQDLVIAQIDIARGVPMPTLRRECRGHAIEVRINAEDPEKGMAPAPGTLRVFRLPAGPGVRVDSGVVEGMIIAPEFDSMVAKLMAWAPTRSLALARLQRALRELQIVVEDGATNHAFLQALLAHPQVVAGTADTAWLDRALAAGEFAGQPHGDYALLTAAILSARAQRQAESQRFFAQVQGGIPQRLPSPGAISVELRLRSVAHTLQVHVVGPDRYLVGEQLPWYAVGLDVTGPYTATLHVDGRTYPVLYAHGRAGVAISVAGSVHIIEANSGGVVLAPAPALVVQVAVQEGQTLEIGQRICTLEAMKLEMPVFAHQAGVVRTVFCRANQQVAAGQPLILLDAIGGEVADDRPRSLVVAQHPRPLDQIVEGERLRAERLDLLPPDQAGAVMADLKASVRGLLLGFDTPALDATRFERMLGRDFRLPLALHPERWLPLLDLLNDFAVVETLFERNLVPVGHQAQAITAELAFYEFCRRHHEGASAALPAFRPWLENALQVYDVHQLESSDGLRTALWRMAVAHADGHRRHRLCAALLRLAIELHAVGQPVADVPGLRQTLERIAQVASPEHPSVGDHAQQAVYAVFERSRYVQRREVVLAQLDAALQAPVQAQALDRLVDAPHTLLPLLLERAREGQGDRAAILAVAIRRLYPGCEPQVLASTGPEAPLVVLQLPQAKRLPTVLALLAADVQEARNRVLAGDFLLYSKGLNCRMDWLIQQSQGAPAWQLDPELAAVLTAAGVTLLTVTWAEASGKPRHRTWQYEADIWQESTTLRDIHPMAAERFELWRLEEFELERLECPEIIVAFRAKARSNAKDERIFVFAEVRQLHLGDSQEIDSPDADLYRAWFEALQVIRLAQTDQLADNRMHWNRITFVVRPVIRLVPRDVAGVARRLEAPARGLGLEKVVIRARVPDARGSGVRHALFVISKPGRHRMQVEEEALGDRPVRALSAYDIKVLRARRLDASYPYELIKVLQGGASIGAVPHPDMAHGRFAEYDLDDSQSRLIPVDRPAGGNVCGVVVGVLVHWTAKYPDGMERVWIASDPTMAMGALAEPECRRILAALDLAQARGLPVEWIPLSSGAKIAMDSGTENLDWTARVLRKIIEFTGHGGVIHVLVAGINVGAQSYWNAEATMLQHTRGCLIMTPDGSMVLTGKKALEYSGGVAAEDERGIGGYDRIMGPNGQAQYHAQDMGEALAILFEQYRFTYHKPQESTPRSWPTTDPFDRSILTSPYQGGADDPFATVGEVFDDRTNPGRKKPFAIREIMAAAIDRDGGRLERWKAMAFADTAVVWDAHMGGIAITLIGFESQPLARRGRVPLDGPDTWTGGTLFPASSKKVARALNAASGNRPVVVLANLSGFDGSPESMRKLQLEYGAEIGRAVVNFQGPIVFVVISRYHGGAYVVFSKALNSNLVALAVEGSFASVIGGGPAAAVVFPREVRRRAEQDQRVEQARLAWSTAVAAQKPRLREQYESVLATVVLEKQGEVAREFDAVHSVDRAVQVGSLDAVIDPARLRPEVIAWLQHSAMNSNQLD